MQPVRSQPRGSPRHPNGGSSPLASALSERDPRGAQCLDRPRLAGLADGIVGARYVVASWTLTMALTSLMVGFALLVGRATGVWGLG